jgi:hypothetical protein
MATLTKDEQKAWAFVKSQNAPVSSRQYGAHMKKDSKAASKIFSALVKKGKLEFISQTDDDGITRHYYLLPNTKPVVKVKPVEEPKPVVEVKPVEESKPEPSLLKDVYDENNYEHNMKLLAKSFFNYIEKDLKLKVAVAPAPKEKEEKEEKEEKDPNAPKLNKEERKEAQQRKKVERESAARREHLRDMLKTWFPAWAHIQSLRFTNPTGRFRTQEEINQSLKEGVMA